MSSLYEMTQTVMYLQSLLESGDIDDQTYHDTIECMCVEGKIEDICKVMKNLEYKAAAFKAEEDRMKSRRQTIENNIKRLKGSVLNYLLIANESKVDAGIFNVSVGKSKFVFVEDERMLPPEYLLPQPAKVDKAAISKALKAGEEVPGAVLVESQYVTVR